MVRMEMFSKVCELILANLLGSYIEHKYKQSINNIALYLKQINAIPTV